MLSIIANVISFIGNCCFTGSSLFKNKKTIMTLQSINHVLSSIAEIIQGAFSGMVQEVVSLVRDLILLFVPNSKKNLKLAISLICIILSIVIGIVFNIIFSNNVWYGYLPVIGTICYSVLLIIGCFLSNNLISEMLIKIGLILNGIAWAAYGILIKLYPTTIFNCITILFSLISIVRIIINLNKIKKVKKNNLNYDEIKAL